MENTKPLSKPKILIGLIVNDGWEPTYRDIAEHFFGRYTRLTYNNAAQIVKWARRGLRKEGTELYCERGTKQLKILDKADELLYQIERNEKYVIGGFKNVFRQQNKLEKDFASDHKALKQAASSVFRMLQQLGSYGILQSNKLIPNARNTRNTDSTDKAGPDTATEVSGRETSE